MKTLWYHWQNSRARQRCPDMITRWLAHWPDFSRPIMDVPLLALDFETTGLDPGRDAILSMGWVPLQAGIIQAGRGQHHIILINHPLPEATIKLHGITHQRMETGLSLEEALERLFAALQGRLPLVHFHRIERRFLATACRQHYGCAPPLPMVDTFELARRQLERQGYPLTRDALRLDSLRQQYGLPDKPPHHALEDALATAELFYAMLKHRSDGTTLPLKDALT